MRPTPRLARQSGHRGAARNLTACAGRVLDLGGRVTCNCNICRYNRPMNPRTPTAGSTPSPRGCTNFKLRKILRRVSRLYDAELAHAGLKTTQFSLLSNLLSLGPVAPGALANAMEMDPSTLTRNVHLLVEQGWVERGPVTDTRSRSLSLTASGRAKFDEALVFWKRAQRTLNAQLGAAQVAALHELIDTALATLNDSDDPSLEIR
jgi:DNA-binding MarR family transcriptional regulator